MKEIHRCCDQHGPIQVLDDGNRRYLSFGNDDEQSCILKHQPHQLQHEYSRAILLVLLMTEPRHIDVIGVGGGTIITALMKLLPDCQFTGIELRQEVIKVAHKYFQLPRDPRLTIEISDGLKFLLKNVQIDDSQRCDVLIADMYNADGIDEQQLSEQFLKAASAHLSEGGWLVLNCWLDHKMEPELAEALEQNFNHVYLCNSGGGNWTIYAGKVDPNKELIDLSQLKYWSKKAGFSLNHFLNRLSILN